MILRNGKKTLNTNPSRIFTFSKNLIPNINLTAVNRNSPSKFSSFYNCVKGGNAAAARLLKKNARGYPQIFPCNARK